ncbi:hypothetical protein BDR04DRAFT_874041 [Suillus decipiens]|nr:hypothetical protein BDR04DRAFT_874041 [Suillus decipiens]
MQQHKTLILTPELVLMLSMLQGFHSSALDLLSCSRPLHRRQDGMCGNTADFHFGLFYFTASLISCHFFQFCHEFVALVM